jgi:Ca-activated chloride channel family protein
VNRLRGFALKKDLWVRGLPGLIIIILLGSCSQVPGKLRVMEGSFLNSWGMPTEAIAAYLDARSYTQSAPYAEYGLGLIYLSLDEGEAARERFSAAEEALEELGGEGHGELIYRLHYNAGIISFQQGDFSGAAEEFRRALEAASGHIEAKRNLELSLLSLAQRQSAAASPLAGGGMDQGQQVLLDYVRQKEQDRWKSREWVEAAAEPGPDY